MYCISNFVLFLVASVEVFIYSEAYVYSETTLSQFLSIQV